MNYSCSRDIFASLGVDTEYAITILTQTPLSLHCWQGDDVRGFESSRISSTGNGCLATGNFPGRARNPDELRADIETAARLIPGPLRINLHASYAEDLGTRPPERNALEASHFRRWLDWAKERHWGIDFNPTCFNHPLADDGFTLSHPDHAVRQFWVEHCAACRRIAAILGEALQNPVVTNIWIPDGYKDLPADRLAPRERLATSLDAIFSAPVNSDWNLDTVEAKLFGLGVESYTVGSHEFYLSYAVQRQIGLCLDAGHFHPTESVADKISAILPFVPHLLTHVSRGVRWDSDHVVILDDPTTTLLSEIIRSDALPRTHLGLDFFDASINRIAAWVIGSRATRKALLRALLEPRDRLRAYEGERNFTARLALHEATAGLPWGAVWKEFCERSSVPDDLSWMDEVSDYETTVLSRRG
jgi:L-rhamnose isomerase